MRERIEKTVSCKDCDYIPKVENAGQVINNCQIMHNGIKVVHGCYHGDWMSEIISRCKGHHEPQEEKAFYEVLKTIKEGATMIEIGSFWAYYSMWFNQQIPNAKNYMVDIDNYVLSVGARNFQLNNMHGYFSIDSLPNFSIGKFMENNKIDYIDILHSDTQGWEYHLLQDCKPYLERIGYFIISTHADKHTPGGGHTPRELLHEDCLQFLTDNNFIILCEHNMKESASHDGLIVAKNPNVINNLQKIELSKLA
jgi:hypothetical protein